MSTFLDAILTDLLTQWETLPLYEPERIETLFQNIGGWLVQVEDEDAYKRWVLRFAIAIQAKHPGIPMSVCLWLIEQRVQDAAKGVLS